MDETSDELKHKHCSHLTELSPASLELDLGPLEGHFPCKPPSPLPEQYLYDNRATCKIQIKFCNNITL